MMSALVDKFLDTCLIEKRYRLSGVLLVIFLIISCNVSIAAQKVRLHIKGEATGTIEIQLYSHLAPVHVERIKTLVTDGAYNGVVFHRVIEGFMAQTGDVKFGNIKRYDPQLVGRGGSNYPDLPEEFSTEPFTIGTVGMARSQDPDSANSQFFLMFEPAPHLDGKYTVIGRVASGLNTLLKIKKGKLSENGSVTEPDYIYFAELID